MRLDQFLMTLAEQRLWHRQEPLALTLIERDGRRPVVYVERPEGLGLCPWDAVELLDDLDRTGLLSPYQLVWLDWDCEAEAIYYGLVE